MMVPRFKRYFLSVTAIFLLIIGFPILAAAGAKIKIDDTKYFQIGMGYRGSLAITEDAAPKGNEPAFDVQMDDLRLYTVSQIHKNIQVEYNTQTQTGNVNLLDAVAKINFGAFEFWLGRQLPPSDRSNLDGPYYLNAAYAFPMVQSFGNLGVSAGRDDGAAIHGDVKGGKFKWAYGLFEGTTGGSDQDDRLRHAGRVDFALLDPEPGFYTGSTYFGAKNLATVGFSFMAEADAVGTATDKGDFRGYSGDFLYERALGNGAVFDFEAAYHDWDLDDKAGHTGNNTAFLLQGKSFLLLTSYLSPNKTSIGGIQGKLQPFFRYQGYNRSFKNGSGNQGYKYRTETGVNFVIDGFNAKVTALWAVDEDRFTQNSGMLAMQFQL